VKLSNRPTPHASRSYLKTGSMLIALAIVTVVSILLPLMWELRAAKRQTRRRAPAPQPSSPETQHAPLREPVRAAGEPTRGDAVPPPRARDIAREPRTQPAGAASWIARPVAVVVTAAILALASGGTALALLSAGDTGTDPRGAVSGATTSPYDIDGDGAVTIPDAVLVLAHVGERSTAGVTNWPGAAYDVNKNGFVSLQDVQIVIAHVGEQAPTPTAQPTVTTTSAPFIAPTHTPPPPPTATTVPATATRVPATATRVPPTATPPPAGGPKLLFGLGDQAPGAKNNRLNLEAPVGMYASWYNGPDDLGFHRNYRDSGFIRNSIYNTGRAAQLIIWSDVPEDGTPCGRRYPISDGINADMAHLAQSWAGTAADPPLYVSLFTEFQTYPCQDNRWVGSEAYYLKLAEKAVQIRDIFHQYAPNSVVCMSWGGWQRRWDNPTLGEGRSLMPHLDGLMGLMDNQCFQAMHDSGNVTDVREMAKYLAPFPGGVYVSHYKPEGSTDATFVSDLQQIMTDGYLTELAGYGLFAWSFMDGRMWNDPDEAASYQLVKDAVFKYGTPP